METSPLTIATNNIKYGITKEVKGLQEKNFKYLKKKIEEDSREWEDVP